MLVLCLDHVAETLDGGQSWHVLAELPTRLTDHPWAHSFAYDPQGDVLYANNREHSGGPYLFGRLALRHWGDVENVAPSADHLETEILPSGNAALVRWKPSQDTSGIAWYRVHVGGQLYGYTERPEIKLSDFAWNERLKLAVQAVDAWQNLSPAVEHTVQFAGQPAGTVLLKDLASSTAAFDGAPMERLVERYTAIDKAASRSVTWSTAMSRTRCQDSCASPRLMALAFGCDPTSSPACWSIRWRVDSAACCWTPA